MSLEKATEQASAAKSHSQSMLELMWLLSSLIISSRHTVLNSAEVCQSQGFTVHTQLRCASHGKTDPSTLVQKEQLPPAHSSERHHQYSFYKYHVLVS